MALSKGRNTKQYGVVKAVVDDLELKQYTAVKIYEGALVCLNSTGYAIPGSAAALIAAGVAMLDPNTDVSDTTGISSGVVTIRVRQGAFWFKNSSDAVTQAQVGKYCWVEDDQTVAKSSSSGTLNAKAGVVLAVDTVLGVLVAVGLQLNPAVAAGAT